MRNTFTSYVDGVLFEGNFPEKCPLCSVTIHTGEPIYVDGLQVVFCCPRCEGLFIAYYSKGSHLNLILNDLKPRKTYLRDISETVQQISPNFVSIYSEACDAKEMGLNQICGAGFRKAFEFLIKDYAKINSDNEVTRKSIESVQAAVVVNNYIKDSRIQDISNRTLWIGNDETHYLRKWDEHDVNDLITLIQLTIHWIDMEYLSRKYITEMPKGKTAKTEG